MDELCFRAMRDLTPDNHQMIWFHETLKLGLLGQDVPGIGPIHFIGENSLGNWVVEELYAEMDRTHRLRYDLDHGTANQNEVMQRLPLENNYTQGTHHFEFNSNFLNALRNSRVKAVRGPRPAPPRFAQPQMLGWNPGYGGGSGGSGFGGGYNGPVNLQAGPIPFGYIQWTSNNTPGWS